MSTFQGRGRSSDRSRPWYAPIRVTKLVLFMLLVCAAGLPLAAQSLVRLVTHPELPHPASIAVLVAAMLLGELLPIHISRPGRTGEVTVSSTFALALAVCAPLGIAVLAQGLPLVVDDLRRGKDPLRPLFNIAQYSLTFAASRTVVLLVAGDLPASPVDFAQRHLVAIFLAGAVFFLVNHGVVGTAIALATRQLVRRHLVEDIQFQLLTSGLLLCLAPLALVGVAFSPVLIVVLLLPIAAVRRSAATAVARERDALHDSLTGLGNRALLQTRLAQALREVDEGSAAGTVLIMLDLDHFKEINDTLGHPVGDQLLLDVARRMQESVRQDAFVARLGGDEFAIVASVAHDQPDARLVGLRLAERLSQVLSEPTTLAGVRVDVRASIGIALSPDHGTDVDELLARADVALYAAKEDRGTWSFYDPARDCHTPERLALLAELRDGLDRDELVLHYQPKCRARTGSVIGMEALVRWQHPVRGLLMPDEFIPIAEQSGLIAPLTMAVLTGATAQARRWMDAGHPINVAVNLSVRHLTDLSLPAQVEQVLRAYQVPAELLTLEVTESTIMNDPTRAVTVLAMLRSLGVRIAVDDYGTGYSSLAYLKRLAIDELKIDKNFVMAMLTDEDTAVIVRSTIELGHNLGLEVVAEGVEDTATWQALLPLGCDIMQGFLISRPMPAEQTLPWLRSWQPPSPVLAPDNDPDANTNADTARIPRSEPC